jgi:hypothetical protein
VLEDWPSSVIFQRLFLLRSIQPRLSMYFRVLRTIFRHGPGQSSRCRKFQQSPCGLPYAGSMSVRRLKGSLHTVQPLYQHRGQPLVDETNAARAWLRKRPADGSDFLFTSQKGGKLSRVQFFRDFQAVAESTGLPLEKRHPHVLKHSLASHLIAGNVNLALVRQALGHRSISSTMQYVDERRSGS